MNPGGEIGAALADDAATFAALHAREPDAGLLRDLRAVGFPDNLAFRPANEQAVQACRMMQQVMRLLLGEAQAGLLDELAADFAAIYLTGAYGASPCESVWTSDDHLTCQGAMFALRALYASAGLAAPDWRQRPDDHLVHQLEFLAHQLAQAESDDDWRSLATFLDEHLLRWLPEFSARVAARCAQPFYAALAMLTAAWCEQLRDLLAQYPGEARPTRDEIEQRCRPTAEARAAPLRFVPGGSSASW